MADPPASQGAIPANILAQIKSNPTVKQLLGTMMVREAGGEGSEGMKDALQVAIDRAVESYQSLQDVLMTPDAFTSMTFTGLGGNRNVRPLTPADLQRAYSVIDDPNLKWDLPTTADAFINPQLQAHYAARDPKHYKATPDWLAGKDPVGTYGHHQFYATGYKGGGKPEQPGAAQGVGQTPGGVQIQMPPGLQEGIAKGIQTETELTEQTQAALDKKGELLKQEFEGAQEYRKSLQAINERFQASNQKIIDSIPDEQKIRQQELAKVSDQPGDPTRVFGQLLPMLAVFGGAFTKAGVTGSLNAAAAAMTAARGHDEDALKKAHTEFQDQLQEVQEKASILHEKMADALAASNGDWNAYLASMNVLAAQYDIPAAKLAAEKGTVSDLLAMQDGIYRTSLQIQDQAIKMADLDLRTKAEAFKENQAQQSQYTPDGEEYMATLGRFGHIPGAPGIPANMGGLGQTPEKARIVAKMVDDAMERWGTKDPQTAAIADISAAVGMRDKGMALSKLANQIPTMEGYIEGLDRITNLLNAQAAKGGTTGVGSWFNKPLRALLTATGDPQTVQLSTLAKTVQDEYAKVLQGSTGSVQAASDSEIKAMNGIINGNLTPNQILAFTKTMRAETATRLAGYQDTFAKTRDDITAGAQRAAAAAPPEKQDPAVVVQPTPGTPDDPLGILP